MSRLLSSLLLIALSAPLLSRADEGIDEEVVERAEALMSQLGSPRFAWRERAGRDLLTLAEGQPLLVVRLLDAGRHEGPLEVRMRCEQLLERLVSVEWFSEGFALARRGERVRGFERALAAALVAPLEREIWRERRRLAALYRALMARGEAPTLEGDERALVGLPAEPPIAAGRAPHAARLARWAARLADPAARRRARASALRLAHVDPLLLVELLDHVEGAAAQRDWVALVRRRLLELDWPLRARQRHEAGRLRSAIQLATAAAFIDAELEQGGWYRLELWQRYRAACAAGMAHFAGERALWMVQDIATLRRHHAAGRHAALLEYLAISGQQRYYGRTLPLDALAIEEPARQARAWPAWLARYPTHPGADDAGYRLGRALEALGKPVEALLAYECALAAPDGQAQPVIRRRIRFVLDGVANAEALARAAVDPRLSAGLRQRAGRCLPIELLREGRPAEAARLMKGQAGSYGGLAWRKRARFAVQLAALVGKPDAASRYQRARLCYHNGAQFRGVEMDAPDLRVMLYLQPAATRRRYFERATGKGRALRLFEALLAALPEAPNRDQARYSAGSAAAHLSDGGGLFELWGAPSYDLSYLERAIAHFGRVAKQDSSPLARRAARMHGQLRELRVELGQDD